MVEGELLSEADRIRLAKAVLQLSSASWEVNNFRRFTKHDFASRQEYAREMKREMGENAYASVVRKFNARLQSLGLCEFGLTTHGWMPGIFQYHGGNPGAMTMHTDYDPNRLYPGVSMSAWVAI